MDRDREMEMKTKAAMGYGAELRNEAAAPMSSVELMLQDMKNEINRNERRNHNKRRMIQLMESSPEVREFVELLRS